MAVTGLGAILLSVMMLASFALLGGGAYLLSGGRNRTKGVLMIVCAAVLIGNVLIWTV